MRLRYASITNNGTEYWFNISEHFEERLEGRFGHEQANKLKNTLALLEEHEFDFGADEEFVVRDFKNKTVVVYSETYKIIKGEDQTVINLITDYVDENPKENGAETFKQAPYSRVIVFDKGGKLVKSSPMYYEDYLKWFQTIFGKPSVLSWKWPNAWKHPNNYKKKIKALKKNDIFCNNINANITQYPPSTKSAKNNILNSAK
jgi:hypothetical protein